LINILTLEVAKRYFYYTTTTTMNTLTKKQAILQSLDAMSSTEMDKVLDYVKDMLYNEENDLNYLQFKRKAIQEIQDALKSDHKVEASA